MRDLARLVTSETDEHDGGFTVAEQVVVLGVLSVVLIIVFSFMINATNLTTRADANVRAEQDAINALRTVTEDLRSATTDGLSACAGGQALSQCVQVEVNKVTSGVAPCPKRVLTYQVTGTNLTQKTVDYAANCTTATDRGTRVLITGIQSPNVFTYYAADGITPLNLATQAALVKSSPAVKVAISVQYRKNADPLSLSSVAALRNNR